MHDVGKMTVDPRVLRKPSRLDEAEWRQIRAHPAEGARIAAGLRPFLGPWFEAIGQHHERWDGSGYPLGLAGTQISYGARIVAMADAFEVMTAARSYKRPVDPGAARAELVRCAGRQFDPDVVRALLGVSLERLHRVLGPAAWLGVLPAAAPRPGEAEAAAAAGSDADLPADPSLLGADAGVLTAVGLHPSAALGPGSATHAAAAPSGHDAGGSAKVTGHGDVPGHDPGAATEHR